MIILHNRDGETIAFNPGLIQTVESYAPTTDGPKGSTIIFSGIHSDFLCVTESMDEVLSLIRADAPTNTAKAPVTHPFHYLPIEYQDSQPQPSDDNAITDHMLGNLPVGHAGDKQVWNSAPRITPELEVAILSAITEMRFGYPYKLVLEKASKLEAALAAAQKGKGK